MLRPLHTRTRDLSGRLPELDGLRGLAVLIVLAYHIRLPGDTGLAVVDAWNRVANIGWSGVDLFFVLSGFLITGILLRTRETPGYFRNFYARRCLRIFPLYFASIAILFFGIRLVPWFEQFDWFWISGENNWWYYPLFLANVSEGIGFTRHASFTVAWSLCVEEQFYLLWPLFVLRYSPRALFRICIAMLVVSPLARWWLLVPFEGDRKLVPWLAPCRMDGLAIGALVAVVLHGGLFSAARLHRLARLGVPLLVATCVWIYWRQAIQPPEDSKHGQDVPVMCWGYALISVAFGAMLALALFERADGPYARVLRAAPLVHVGKYSFAIYLIHYPVHVALTESLGVLGFMADSGEFPRRLVVAPISLGTTWLLSILSWRLLEQPFLSLKRYFEYSEAGPIVAEEERAA